MGFAGMDVLKSLSRFAVMAMVLGGSGALLAGCNTDPDIDITKLGVESDPPEVLYNQALANMNAGKTSEASRKFDAIDKQHPFSEYARKALVMGAFVRYRDGAYEEAIAAGNRYMNLYPNTEDAAYAQYIIGLSYSKQISDVTQDQTAATKTIQAMTAVVTNYPKSEYVDDAQAKIRMARDQLAGKEMQVGRYYQERKEYIAAISRYRVVVEQYQNTNQVEEALARLVECNFALGLESEAQTAAAVLGNNYPDGQWYADSYKLLKSGGLEPRENTGSWLSRAGKKLLGGS
jgi:outer membrane protein assembly factor BamD